jgi:ATP-dependent DNA helicase RecG
VTKYLPFYTKGGDAIFIEDSMFTTVIPLIPTAKENYIRKNVKETPVKTPVKAPVKTPGKILSLIKKNPSLTIPELAEKMKKSESAVERTVRKLRESKHLKRIGPDKGGHWKVIGK